MIRKTIQQRPLMLLALILTLAVATLVGGCSEDTEYKQTFSFPLEVNLANKYGSDMAGDVASMDYVDIEHLFPVGVDMAEGNIDLKAASDAGELEELVIDQIAYTVTGNTATIDIPAIEVYVGPEGMKTVTDEAVLIGTLPAIPKEATPSGVAELEPVNFVAAGQYIFPLNFAIVTRTTTSVQNGETVPGGKIDVELDVQLTMLAGD